MPFSPTYSYPRLIILLITFTICNITFIYASTNPIDSIYKILEQTKEPEGKINQYKELFKKIPGGDTLRIKYAHELLNYSKEVDLTSGEALAYTQLGFHQIYSLEIDEAIENLKMAIDYYEQLGEFKNQTNAIGYLGICYERLGDAENAEKMVDLGLAVAKKSGEDKSMISAYKRLAEFHGNVKGDKVKGIEFLEEAFKYVDKSKDKENYHMLLDVKSVLYATYDNKIAIKTANEAIELAKELNKPTLRLKTQLAYLYHYEGNIKKSMEITHELLVEATERNDLFYKLQGLSRLGNLNVDMRNHEKAIEYFLECIDLAIENNTENSALDAYFGLGLIYNQSEDSSAVVYFEKALELAGGNIYYKSQILPEAGSAYLIHGYYEKAKKAFEEVIEIIGEDKNSNSYYHAVSGLSKYYFEKDNFKKAKVHALEVLDYAKENSNHHLQNFTAIMLGVIAEKEKDYKKASEYKDIQLALIDSLKIAETQEKITSLEMTHEFEIEKEVAEAKRVAEIKQAETEKLIIKGYLLGAGMLALFTFIAYRSTAKRNKTIRGQNQQLEELSAANEQLLFSLSHDIKEPMLGVQMLLDEINLDDLQLESAKNSLNNQVKSINGILRNLLEVKKNQGQVVRNIEGQQILVIIQEVLESQIPKAKSKNLSVNIDADQIAQLKFDLSPQKFYLLMLNTLNNAIKYSPKNGYVNINASQGELTITNNLKAQDSTNKNLLKSDGIGLALVEQLLKNTKVSFNKIWEDDKFILNISSVIT